MSEQKVTAEEMAKTLKDAMQWIAAFARGNSATEYATVVNSPRYEKYRAILARRGLSAGWQPIETAPKDGTRILSRNYYTQFVAWKERPDPRDQMKNIGSWITDFGDAVLPVYWLPLPSPPQQDRKEGDATETRNSRPETGRPISVAQPPQKKCRLTDTTYHNALVCQAVSAAAHSPQGEERYEPMSSSDWYLIEIDKPNERSRWEHRDTGERQWRFWSYLPDREVVIKRLRNVNVLIDAKERAHWLQETCRMAASYLSASSL